MFSKFITWIRGVINKMFKRNEIGSKFNVDVIVSDKMSTAIDLWVQLFENKAPWLDNDTKSLNLPSAIAGEIARMVTLELESEITGSVRADFLNTIYQTFLSGLRINTEYACAKGGIVFKPYIKGENELAVEAIQANKFYPTEYDSRGKIIGGIFVAQKVINNFYYTRLEYQRFVNDLYVIDNLAFESTNKGTLGSPVLLTQVDEWAELQPRVAIKNLERPLFSYFKIPLANQIDADSPLGVSVYSRAIDLIKEADKQYSRILWEYEGSELAIDADITVLQTAKNNDKLGLPKLKDRLFRGTGQSREGSFYEVFSPTIRDTSLFNGLNKILQKIEFVCGLAYGTISDPQQIEKTAEEIRHGKQRSYANVSDIQKALQDTLNDLIYTLDAFCSLYGLAPAGEYETSYKWDDSIVVDAQAERTRDAGDVAMGVMRKEEYRAKWYGESIEEAMKNLPQQADVLE